MDGSSSALAARIHNSVLQLLGSALLKAELAEALSRMGRGDEVPAHLNEMRTALEDAATELRSIMADLRAGDGVKGKAA
jgi:signal transduction histidine kinase